MADPLRISQGMGGMLTHRGLWKWALDFEVASSLDSTADMADLRNYPTFGRPVFAPCDGIVSRVIASVPDNRPGENNPNQNWGNFVIIQADLGYFVMLAHFRQGGVSVVPGQRVRAGDPIGQCGNSGRSPLPHLHVQVQEDGRPGSPTREFVLCDHLEMSGENPTFQTTSQPPQGTVLSSANLDPMRQGIFAGWLPGNLRYEIQADNGVTREETLSVGFDELGRFLLQSLHYEARAVGFFSGTCFYFNDFEGNGTSLLALVALGLARVPCVDATGAVWRDHFPVAVFRRGVCGRLREAASPYLWPELAPYNYRTEPSVGGLTIHATVEAGALRQLPPGAPVSMEVSFAERLGPVRLEAILRDDTAISAKLKG